MGVKNLYGFVRIKIGPLNLFKSAPKRVMLSLVIKSGKNITVERRLLENEINYYYYNNFNYGLC